MKTFAMIGSACISLIFFTAHGVEERESSTVRMLRAYHEMNYAAARKLAKARPETPESRLIRALCDVYDRRSQDITRGQRELERIFQDGSLPEPYRIEAGLALGRTAQLMKKRRELYGSDADRYDHLKTLREVAALAPAGASGAAAMFYVFQELLENPETAAVAFTEMEAYLRNFGGDRGLLVPLHLLAEYEYIRLRKDYKNAVRHLENSCKLGITNPNEARDALFRLEFLCYKKLGDRKAAGRYFNEYLAKHRFSGQAVVARRFLEEMKKEERRNR